MALYYVIICNHFLTKYFSQKMQNLLQGGCAFFGGSGFRVKKKVLGCVFSRVVFLEPPCYQFGLTMRIII